MLTQALDSVLGQESVALEVIVVDEASSDDTTARLAQIDDRRMTVIRHETPRGPAAARNAAIARARGEWIAFLDDDDLWAPNKLDLQLSRALLHENTLSYSGRVEIDEELSVGRLIRPSTSRPISRQLLLDNAINTPSSVLIHTGLLERVGLFDERFWGMEDWDLWLRAVAGGASVGACPETLLAYRRHDIRTSTDEAKMWGDFERLRDKHGSLADRAGVEFGAAWLADWRGARDIAEKRRLRPARRYLRTAVADRSAWNLVRAVSVLSGPSFQRLGRWMVARATPRPEWLDRYV